MTFQIIVDLTLTCKRDLKEALFGHVTQIFVRTC